MSRLSSMQLASALPGANREHLPGWCFAELAGQVCELSGVGATANVTMAMRMVWEAQCAGESAAWVTTQARCFFPPDAEAAGVDLASLAVARMPQAADVGKAADYLVRSNAFGLVVLDVPDESRLTEKQLTRLLGLARRHGTAVICLTAKPDNAPSLGSVVSLRGPVRRERVGDGTFACVLEVLKDKRRPPGWRHKEVCRGPAGLR